MTTVSPDTQIQLARPRLSRRSIIGAMGLAVVVLQVVMVTSNRPGARRFPDSWNVKISEPIDKVQSWVRNNQYKHWIFTRFFTPISRAFKWTLEGLTSQLLALPWFALPLFAFAVLAWRRRWKASVAVAVVACYPGAVGLAKPTMQTVALMIVSVAVSLLIGIPLGIWSALSPRANRIIRPVLDAMQTVPSTVYFIPAVLLFGIGPVPAAFATVVFALPPAVRLTALGITQVPPATVEAGEMYGSSKRQLLTKVQLPQALPSIAAGINQTIMMALGIVVIAALVGAGGLGQEVLDTIQLRAPGRGMVAGLAVVAVAVVLDRVSAAFVTKDRDRKTIDRKILFGCLGSALVLIVVGRLAGWNTFPVQWKSSFADPLDSGIKWVRDHGRGVTRPLNDFIVRDVLLRVRNIIGSTIAWPAVVGGAALLGYVVKGWKMAVGITLGLLAIAFTGMWQLSIETLVQVVFATLVSALIALPVGIWIGRHPRAESAVAPILDALQTIPSLIYTIPFVMIFTISVVPGGIIASALYAIPAGIRLSALGIRQVPEAPLEAAESFGASKRQQLWGVQLPLAMPSIILAFNQLIMMVLSMVVIAGLTGSGALGFEAVSAFKKTETGRAVEVSIAILVIATILDRLTQALAQRRR
jgi:glycine betaine/proline transport system permease protein